METLLSLLAPALLSVLAVRLFMLPIKWGYKFLIHAASGFLCLWTINLVAGYTGISIPVNAVTVGTAGFLGIPGILLMMAVEFI